MAKVELKLRCFNLPALDFFSKSDPMVVVYTKPDGASEDKWEEVGRTECVLNNLAPVFLTSITLDWKINTGVKFDVWDMDEENKHDLTKGKYIGYFTISLSDLVCMGGAATGRKHLHAKNGLILANGSISILATVQGGDLASLKAEAAENSEDQLSRKSCMLYWGPQTASSLGVLALAQAQLTKEVRPEKVDATEAKAAKFVELNPAGTVPFLDDAGFAVSGAPAILRYLCNKFPAIGTHFYPPDLHVRTAVDGGLDWYLIHSAQGAINVGDLEGRLTQHPYMAGNFATIADFAVWPEIGLLPEAATAKAPNVKKWLTAMSQYGSVLKSS